MASRAIGHATGLKAGPPWHHRSIFRERRLRYAAVSEQLWGKSALTYRLAYRVWELSASDRNAAGVRGVTSPIDAVV